ncbi:MAG: hypothetical protein LBF58_10075 [Deltaproteobacteria bacterium]|jgi:hypothetical protein|nr:hypothetical protein [Deltaproteobacteria bacterium]
MIVKSVVKRLISLFRRATGPADKPKGLAATRGPDLTGPKAGPKARARACPAKALVTILAGLGLALKGAEAWAVGLGGLGQNVASNLSGVAKAVQMFGFAAGLTLVVMGLLELYNTGRSHDASLKGGVTKCVVGAALLAVDAIISTFSTTIFGGNESGVGLGGLGL